MQDIIGAVAAPLAEWTVRPIWRQFGYVIHYKSNIEHLTAQVQELCDKRDGVNLEVKPATESLKIIDPGVKRWLNEVDNIIDHKETCFKQETVAIKAICCHGWFPNLKSRYSLGRKAKRMGLEVENLVRQANNFTAVVHPAPPPEIGFPPTQYSEESTQTSQLIVTKFHQGASSSSSGTSNLAPPHVSRQHFDHTSDYRLLDTEEVWNALHDDNIHTIGICGIIKGEDTVTAREFIQKVEQQNLFEEVVVAVVSKNPDLKQIQSQVAERLGLNVENKTLPEGAKLLHAKMSMDSTKPCLVILADAWEMLDLEAVGIPASVGSRTRTKCKLILMSPVRTFFDRMRSQSSFKLLLASTPIQGNLDFESRKATVRDVMEALKGDEISPIVICGMGGVGKTTLVEEVVNKAKIEGLFDQITKAILTQPPDLGNIQDQIAEYLGLQLTDKGMDARGDKLRKRLSGCNRVLVILDNVWESLNLWRIGIPCDPKSCKVLVSSRNQDIFNEMENRKNFPIGVLPELEAWSLFKQKAGGSIEYDPELCPIAKQILNQCNGLPIAISTLGSALRQKKKSFWKDALRRLQKPSRGDIMGIENKVYKTIKLSYDILESEVQSCFLLCCLFPESSNILLGDLVKYGFGLGIFQGIDSMEGGRDRVEALVDTLKSCYLLLDSDEKGCIRMHDVVRDVALYIASDEGEDRFVVNHRVELKDWPTSGVSGQCTYSSLTNNRSTRLLLFSCTGAYRSLEPPATFFKGMEDLRVLDIKSTILLPILPSLPLLKTLQTLRLEHCNLNLEMAGSVIGKLETLMILSLRGSSMERLPDEFKNLSNLRLLDLTDCCDLKTSSPGVISSLSCLEELYNPNSFQDKNCTERSMHTWRAFPIGWSDGTLSELFSLSCLTSLQTVLPPIDNLRKTMLFHKLERFEISIGCMLDRWSENPHENCLRVYDHCANSLLGTGITVLLKKTDSLELEMKNLTYPLNVLDRECCVNLKSLRLDDCRALKYLIDMSRKAPPHVFPVLNSLMINGARRLKEIFHGQLPMGSLKVLSKLHLSTLPALTHFLKIKSRSECLEILGLVEELGVRDCNSLEAIVVLEESEHHEDTANEISFSNLLTLNLQNLPSLIGINKNIYKVNFPRLIELELHQLPSLICLCPSTLALESSSIVAVQHLLDPKDEKSFLELRSVQVKNCDKICGVFSSNCVQNLQNLEQVEVGYCCSLKTVFDFEGLEIKKYHAAATLSCLKKMELIHLPCLQYMWKPPHHIMAFQNLRELKVSQCTSLKYMFPLFIVEGLLNLELMDVWDCHMMEVIVAKDEDIGVNGKASNQVVFPHLRTLHLDKLPCLTGFTPSPYTFDWPAVVLTGSRMPIDDAEKQFQAHIFNEEVDFPVLRGLGLSNMCNFKEIWSNQLPHYSFSELRFLNVSNCKDLLHLVPTYMQNRLQKLEWIWVHDCSSLEEIFELRRSTVNEDTVTISQTQETIHSVSQQTHHQGFQHLTAINICGCNGLRHMFSPSIARGLVKLKYLSVFNCYEMEEILTAEAEGGETEDDGLLPELISLEIRGLPNLTSFSQGKYTFEWPLVRSIDIYKCLKMKHFCLGSLSTPRAVHIMVSDAGENLLHELNSSRKET